MRIQRITPSVLQAAVAMLSPYVAELSATALVEAIQQYKSGGAPDRRTEEKPYTRREAAALLGVSVVSIGHMLNDGRLTRVYFGPRTVRVTPESVRALLSNTAKINAVTETEVK